MLFFCEGAWALASETDGPGPLVAGAGAFLDPRVTIVDPQDVILQDLQGVLSQETILQEPEEETLLEAREELLQEPEEEILQELEEETSTLVMADVNEMMNVRALPDATSEKIGVLYKDCGGTILERENGWTKLQSGELIGWASDDYLLFGEEALALAADVGVRTATVTGDSLRVRKTPSTDGGVYGLVRTGDALEVIAEDDGSGFVTVEYKGKEAYVSADYVEISVHVDTGETWETILKREEEERQRKAKLVANQGAVAANTDEVRLLAALVQCEAGNQSYEGQLGVAAVVMNRVRSGAYPNTIYGVIYASGQFGPAAGGQVAAAYVGDTAISQSCFTAAQAAINGETTVGGALHFRRAGGHEGTVIGSHVFW